MARSYLVPGAPAPMPRTPGRSRLPPAIPAPTGPAGAYGPGSRAWPAPTSSPVLRRPCPGPPVGAGSRRRSRPQRGRPGPLAPDRGHGPLLPRPRCSGAHAPAPWSEATPTAWPRGLAPLPRGRGEAEGGRRSPSTPPPGPGDAEGAGSPARGAGSADRRPPRQHAGVGRRGGRPRGRSRSSPRPAGCGPPRWCTAARR